jgi:N-methylhydantoinase B
VSGRDGFDQIGPIETLGGLVIPNAETYEQLYPMRVLKQEFRCDAGGAGARRGGTGVHYVAELNVEAEYAFRAEGMRRAKDNGVNGGRNGAKGEIRVMPRDGEPFVPPTYGVQRLPPLRLEILAPGGGGWGDPHSRDPELVRQDVRDGLVSREAAEKDYGVAITLDCEVELGETSKLRAKRRRPRAAAAT